MKVAVILENAPNCTLEREEFEIPADCEDEGGYVDEIASGIIEGWILTAGDTIRIVEVES
jgi:hypothetical protein